MIISYLGEKLLCKKKDRAKHVKFINYTNKKIKGSIVFSRWCFTWYWTWCFIDNNCSKKLRILSAKAITH